MKHTLPKLPYESVPGISEKTFDYHHGKHHRTYVNNLNKLIPGTKYENMSLENIVKKSSGSIYNNAAQHWNHSFLWKSMTDEKGMDPSEELVEAIEKKFGSFDAFKKQFLDRASKVFGSGWVSLVKTSDGLTIKTHKNADSPLLDGDTLLIVDVWEHAYYIDYYNERADYLDAFWNVINWDFVSDNYRKSK